jgi:hypothetical protein
MIRSFAELNAVLIDDEAANMDDTYADDFEEDDMRERSLAIGNSRIENKATPISPIQNFGVPYEDDGYSARYDDDDNDDDEEEEESEDDANESEDQMEEDAMLSVDARVRKAISFFISIDVQLRSKISFET